MRNKLVFVLLILSLCLLSSCEIEFNKTHNPERTVWFVGFGADYKGRSYEGRNVSLTGTVPDAVELGKAFGAISEKLNVDYEKIIITDDCRWSKYQDLLLEKLHPKKDDIVIFSFSAHGSGQQSDEIDYGDDVLFKNNGIYFYSETGKTINNIPYSKIVGFIEENFDCAKMILCDVCYSGSIAVGNGVTVDKNSYKNKLPMTLFYPENVINASSDMWILCAGTYSQEVSDGDDHGAFTKAVLDALGWDEDNQTIGVTKCLDGNLLTAGSIARYVYTHGGARKNYWGDMQQPVFSSGSSDLVLFCF